MKPRAGSLFFCARKMLSHPGSDSPCACTDARTRAGLGGLGLAGLAGLGRPGGLGLAVWAWQVMAGKDACPTRRNCNRAPAGLCWG